jgi:hypothetical protein
MFSVIIRLIVFSCLQKFGSGLFGGKAIMKDSNRPIGTLVFLLIYLVVIIASWIGVYLLMLSRGGNL